MYNTARWADARFFMPDSIHFDLIPILALIFGLGTFWFLGFFLIYHLTRFGIGTSPKRLAFIFLSGALILTIITVLFFTQVQLLDFVSVPLDLALRHR